MSSSNEAPAAAAAAAAVIEDDEAKPKFKWPPLESNPDVFTSYLHGIGLPSTFQVGEVFGFDEDLLAFIPQPVLGTVVCFERLKPKAEFNMLDNGSADNYDRVNFYMHQSGTLDNACGIVACLHAMFNSPLVSVDKDSVLGRFQRRCVGQTPAERCKELENDDDFKRAHRSNAAKGQSRSIDGDQSKVRHHFIAYVMDKEGKQLVELDGTKVSLRLCVSASSSTLTRVIENIQAGPVMVGECSDVLRGSIQAIRGKLERGEISESLSMMTLGLAD